MRQPYAVSVVHMYMLDLQVGMGADYELLYCTLLFGKKKKKFQTNFCNRILVLFCFIYILFTLFFFFSLQNRLNSKCQLVYP